VKSENIISISLDDLEYAYLLEPIKLFNYIKERIVENTNYYLLIDEIQSLDGYESLLNSLNYKGKIDIYVTGSNSKLLSNEISTNLRGRDDQIKLYPLTFKEIYTGFDKYQEFNIFMRYGGMPFLLNLKNDEDKEEYLKSLFNLVYIKDIVERNRVDKVEVLESIVNTISSSSCNGGQIVQV
jgi:predicted AAA+ superfamily ATPase